MATSYYTNEHAMPVEVTAFVYLFHTYVMSAENLYLAELEMLIVHMLPLSCQSM